MKAMSVGEANARYREAARRWLDDHVQDDPEVTAVEPPWRVSEWGTVHETEHGAFVEVQLFIPSSAVKP